MKGRILLVVISVSSLMGHAQMAIIKSSSKSNIALTSEEYNLEYNNDLKICTYGCLEIRRNVQGQHFQIEADPRISGSAEYIDYYHSGYTPVQLIPSQFITPETEEYHDTFKGTNYIPMEDYAAKLLKQVDDRVGPSQIDSIMRLGMHILMISGPVLKKSPETFGYNEIPVPEGAFKILFYFSDKRAVSYVAFYVPQNAKLNDIRYYTCSLSFIENLTGLSFGSGSSEFKSKSFLSDWKYVIN